MGHHILQASDTGNEHRLVEIKGYLCYAALGCSFIRLDHKIGGAEKQFYLLILNETVEKDNILFDSGFLYQLAIWRFVFIEFPGNKQL